MDSDDFVCLSRAAELTGLSRPTVRRMVERGIPQDFRIESDRRSRFIRRSALEALLAPVPQSQPAQPRKEMAASTA